MAKAKRPNPLVFALGLAVGVGGALYFRMAPPAFESPEAPAERAAEPASPIRSLPDYHPANPAAREDAIRATRLPSELRHPIEPQYRAAERSRVPHELIAAYDESPGTARGPRRRLILAVPPDTKREALEQLVEHLRAQHLAAAVLRIHVYDSKVAATHPIQAGVSSDPHLIASYERNGASATYELHGEPAPLD